MFAWDVNLCVDFMYFTMADLPVLWYISHGSVPRYIAHGNIHEINTWKCPIQTQCG